MTSWISKGSKGPFNGTDAIMDDTGVNAMSEREQYTRYIQMARLAQETVLRRHNIGE